MIDEKTPKEISYSRFLIEEYKGFKARNNINASQEKLLWDFVTTLQRSGNNPRNIARAEKRKIKKKKENKKQEIINMRKIK